MQAGKVQYRTAIFGVVTTAALFVGYLVPAYTMLAITISAFTLFAVLTVITPVAVMVAPFAIAAAYWRVGPEALNMSVCDAATVLAMVAAFPFIPWKNPVLRRILWGFGCYLVLLLLPLAAHPTGQAFGEWFHRSILFGGALMVGAAVANRGKLVLAMRVFLAASGFIAVAAIINAIQTGLGPAYPFGIHKNAVGVIVGVGIVALHTAQDGTGIQLRARQILMALLVVGLGASQSRGACLAVVAVVAISVLRKGSRPRRIPVFLLVASVILIVGSAVTLRNESQADPKFNSVDSRIEVFDYAINNVWHADPIMGGGIRWFRNAATAAPTPHNLIVAELSESGLIGLAALLLLTVNTLAALGRRRDGIGDTAFFVFCFILLASLSGIFWVAGSLTLPMLIVGLAAGSPTVSANGPTNPRLRSGPIGSPAPTAGGAR